MTTLKERKQVKYGVFNGISYKFFDAIYYLGGAPAGIMVEWQYNDKQGAVWVETPFEKPNIESIETAILIRVRDEKKIKQNIKTIYVIEELYDYVETLESSLYFDTYTQAEKYLFKLKQEKKCFYDDNFQITELKLWEGE